MQTLLDQFEHIYSERRGEGHLDPEWLSNTRANAYKNLKQVGFPTPKDELWKYTSIRDLLQQPFALPNENFNLENDLNLSKLPILNHAESIKIFVINGTISGKYSDLSNLPSGCNLICYPEDATNQTFDFITDHEDASTYHKPMSFALLNTILFPEIIYFSIKARQSIQRPIEFCFIHQANSHAHCYTSSPRLNIYLEEKAQCKIIENHVTIGSSQAFINMRTQTHIHRKGNLERYIYQNCNPQSFFFSHNSTEIDQKAHLTEFTFNRGGKTIRQENLTKFIGQNSDCHVSGAACLKANQHVDSTIYIDHAMPKCASRQVVKNVLTDHSESVFQGKIHVASNAQKTDGFQLNKTLLLSEDATANSKPELEIYADDVKCSHGATSGFLQEKDLFYLQSRGISEEEASRLLVTAFLQEALDEIKDDAIKADFRKQMIETLKETEDHGT